MAGKTSPGGRSRPQPRFPQSARSLSAKRAVDRRPAEPGGGRGLGRREPALAHGLADGPVELAPKPADLRLGGEHRLGELDELGDEGVVVGREGLSTAGVAPGHA